MNLQQAYMMAKGGKWIKSAIKRPGALTKKAQAAGMGVQEFANKVSSNPEEFTPRTRRQANLAKTLKKIRKGEDGMEVPESEMPRTEAIDPNLEFAKKDLSSLEKQAERENVREYQRMLNRKFGAGLSEDGAWGPKTQAAYEKFMASKKAQPTSSAPKKAQEPGFVEMMNTRMGKETPKPRTSMFVPELPSFTTEQLSKDPTPTLSVRDQARKNIADRAAKNQANNMMGRRYNMDLNLSKPQTVTPEMAEARKNIAERAKKNQANNMMGKRSTMNMTLFKPQTVTPKMAEARKRIAERAEKNKLKMYR